MHSLATQLAPVLAAEKSKTPFYILGGVLVLWALVLSLAIGLRRPNFPDSLRVERGVIAISVTLVLATVTAAVLTSGSPSKSEAATTTKPQGTETGPAPAEPERPATPGAPPAPAGPTAPGPTARRTLHLSVPGAQLAYSTKTLTTKAGEVSIAMTNMSPLEHNVTVEQGGKVLGATPTFLGGTKTLTLNLKAGTYKFFCSVPGHRQAGMEGTLTVQ